MCVVMYFAENKTRTWRWFFFFPPLLPMELHYRFSAMYQGTILILQNCLNCCALCDLGTKIECLKHGEAELVGNVEWADLLVTSRSCAALVVDQMYVAYKDCLSFGMAGCSCSLEKRVQIDSYQAGCCTRNWVGRLNMGLISQLAGDGWMNLSSAICV